MPATFPGYPKKGLTWLRQIAKHNEREWFAERKAIFEDEVKAPTVALVEALNARLERFAPDYVADPKKAIGRIYRDTRFSKDKSPYKTYMSARFSRHGGKPDACAGFWLSVSAAGVNVVGGSYTPGTPQLAALRARIADDTATFRKLCARKALADAMGALQGEQLKRAPRGWDPEHPAVDLLRHKQFYFEARLPLSVAGGPGIVKEVARRFELMTPFVGWLDAAMS